MFRNRYGMDKLNRALIIGALILSAFTILFRTGVLRAVFIGISCALIIIALVRMFSTDVNARHAESQRYEQMLFRMKNWFTRKRGGASKVVDFNERKQYKYLSCPQCMQKLRVPRGKGKLRVTCAKCGCKFDAKS